MPEYIDFSKFDGIQIDIETYDPNLKEMGSGVYRKDGFILGVGIGDIKGNKKEYFPLAHSDTTKAEEQKNLDYIRKILALPIPKLGANIKYDLDWLVNGYGIIVNGDIHDIQLAEPLLDEYRYSYSLENLAKDYLGETKTYDETDKWCEKHGIKLKKPGESVKYLKDMPYDVVRSYVLGDITLPGRIFKFQKAMLEKENLWDLYRMECDLTPMLLQMRRTGVRIDKKKMMKTGMALSDAIYKAEKDLFSKINREINVKSSKDVQWAMDKLGLEYPYNPPTKTMLSKGIKKGNPNLDKKVLSTYDHWLPKSILMIRHMRTLNSMFIQPYYEMLVGDRLHADFNQLKADDGGTVSGRFSSSRPNLQQVSGKEEEDAEALHELLKGQIIRDIFLPEEGADWGKLDWSQIEYRIMAHYAIGPRSDEIRERYRKDPRTDYHEEMQNMTGLPDRKTTKTLNFGAAYGMGWRSMAKNYGWEEDYAQHVYNSYHLKVPFVEYTANRVASKAKATGFIKTILGRRARLKNSDKAYVMFNRLIQGGAADIMKKAMLDAYQANIFDVLPVHLTVHDELDVSKPRNKECEEAFKELKNIMENCVELKVPIIADAEVGNTWGNLKDYQ